MSAYFLSTLELFSLPIASIALKALSTYSEEAVLYADKAVLRLVLSDSEIIVVFFIMLFITSTTKQNLTNAYNDYVSMHTQLKNKVNATIKLDKVTDADSSAIQTLFEEYGSLLATLSVRFNEALESISLNKAKNEIEKAKEDINTEITETNNKT